MLGIFFAMISAACFGFQNASARRGALSGTAMQGLVTSMVAGTVLFLVCTIAFGEWSALERMSLTDIGFLSAAGFAHFVWGRYWNIRALGAIGANLAGPVQQYQLLLSLSLAIVFLGEYLTPLKVLGIVLVVSAPAFILHQRRAKTKRAKAQPAKAVGADVAVKAATDAGSAETKSKFTPRLLEGYICAILSGLGFGSSAVLAKAGLMSTGAGFAGGFVSYICAIIFVGIMLMNPRNLSELRAMRGEARKWFFVSGMAVSFSQMFRYLALSVAPVTVTQPIQATSLIWRMVFGYFINREHEAFDRFVLIGLCLSFAGAFALAISDGMVLSYFDAPAWMIELSHWKWPNR
jgi:drug/metabolite transporter (DMT)-like permease